MVFQFDGVDEGDGPLGGGEHGLSHDDEDGVINVNEGDVRDDQRVFDYAPNTAIASIRRGPSSVMSLSHGHGMDCRPYARLRENPSFRSTGHTR